MPFVEVYSKIIPHSFHWLLGALDGQYCSTFMLLDFEIFGLFEMLRKKIFSRSGKNIFFTRIFLKGWPFPDEIDAM